MKIYIKKMDKAMLSKIKGTVSLATAGGTTETKNTVDMEVPVLGAQFYTRCADRQACTKRFVSDQQLSRELHSSH